MRPNLSIEGMPARLLRLDTLHVKRYERLLSEIHQPFIRHL
jgi:hypothetical protein